MLIYHLKLLCYNCIIQKLIEIQYKYIYNTYNDTINTMNNYKFIFIISIILKTKQKQKLQKFFQYFYNI